MPAPTRNHVMTTTHSSAAGPTPAKAARLKTPPEDMFCQDLNAISVIRPPKGPRTRRTRHGLDQGTKRLLALVSALSYDSKCDAGDDYLAWRLGASLPSVSRWIAEAHEFGILDVRRVGGRRRLSINAGKLDELKAAYLKALAARSRRHADDDDSQGNANQVDGQEPIKLISGANQVDGREPIKLIASANQVDGTTNQLDGLIDTSSRYGSRNFNDNGPLDDARAPTAASSFIDRISKLKLDEEVKQEEVAAARDALDAIEARTGLTGLALREDAAWRAAERSHDSAITGLLAIQESIASLHGEAELEEERSRLEADRARKEAELTAWRKDPAHRIVADPSMVLDAFQAACRRRFPGETISFPSRDGQVEVAAEVLKLLKDRRELTEVVLRAWIDWYPANCLNAESPAHHITVRYLSESWGRFSRRACPRGLSKVAERDMVLALRRATATPPSAGPAERP